MTTGLPRTYAEVRWTDDLDPNGADTASDLESLEQDVLHILSQRIGSNIADPHKGLGVIDYLNGTSVTLEALPSLIDAQLAQVTRITSSSSTLTLESDGTYRIFIKIGVAGQVVDLQFVLGPGGLVRA